MAKTPPPIKFGNPPVTEVVCGVQFAELKHWHSQHFGLFWTSLKDTFPLVEEKQPIGPAIEGPLGPAAPPRIEFMSNVLPRVWFQDENKSMLLQIQSDRMLFNWRKTEREKKYPSFDVVIAEFEKYFAQFRNFVAKNNIGDVVAKQYEVTYVNHITRANGLEKFSHDVIFSDHMRNESNTRFLGPTESIDLKWTYELPNSWGRLFAQAQTAFLLENNEQIIRFEITARGWPISGEEKARSDWFQLAHDWITRGFADMTRPEAHEIWKRES